MTDRDFFPPVSTWSLMPKLMGQDRPLGWICVDDLGTIAARAFVEPDRFVGAELALASDVQSIAQCRRIWQDVYGRPPRHFPMPVWMFRRFVGSDLITMWRWLRTAQVEFDPTPTREEMILDKNIFVERVLPASVIRTFTDEEMAGYRGPFVKPGEDRLRTLSWPRQIPVDGELADVVETVRAYGAWLSTSDVPKLFINAEPGSILIGRQREFCRTWPHQEEVTVAGLHFIQEDSADEIGEAVAAFVRRNSG